MSKEYLPPKSDIVFKMIFGDERNKDILTSFLKSVLSIDHDDYEELTIIDPHLKRDYANDKLGILDVKIHTKSKRTIDVEIQVLDIPKMRERILFYTSKMITEQIKSGDQYEIIKPVISIIITDYSLIEENSEYHNKYRLYDKHTGSELTNVLEINTLELSKLPANTDETTLWSWMKFLKSKKKEEIEMIAEASPEIKKAVCVLAKLSQDERTRLLYESREKARRDEASRLKGAFTDGELKGEKNKQYEIALNLLNKGQSLEFISEVTGLSIDTLKTPLS